MKSVGNKCVFLLLALFILTAAVVPACAGSENCSMPCCRHKAKPVSHHTDPAHPKPCCSQTADASSGIGSGCRFDQHHIALLSGGETGPIIAATAVAVVLQNPMPLCTSARATGCPDSDPPETPLYLRLQTLLI
jgi:hypothetical protein